MNKRKYSDYDYQRGLVDAWRYIKKISYISHTKVDVLYDIFGLGNTEDIINEFDIIDVIERFKHYGEG